MLKWYSQSWGVPNPVFSTLWYSATPHCSAFSTLDTNWHSLYHRQFNERTTLHWFHISKINPFFFPPKYLGSLNFSVILLHCCLSSPQFSHLVSEVGGKTPHWNTNCQGVLSVSLFSPLNGSVTLLSGWYSAEKQSVFRFPVSLLCCHPPPLIFIFELSVSLCQQERFVPISSVSNSWVVVFFLCKSVAKLPFFLLFSAGECK